MAHSLVQSYGVVDLVLHAGDKVFNTTNSGGHIWHAGPSETGPPRP